MLCVGHNYSTLPIPSCLELFSLQEPLPGWLKNTLSCFWPGEYKKKKSCKNRVANPKVFFSYTTVRLLLQELPCQDLVRRKRSHSDVEGDLPEVPQSIQVDVAWTDTEKEHKCLHLSGWAVEEVQVTLQKDQRERVSTELCAQNQGSSWELLPGTAGTYLLSTWRAKPSQEKMKSSQCWQRSHSFPSGSDRSAFLTSGHSCQLCWYHRQGSAQRNSAIYAQAFWEEAAINQKEKRELSFIQLPWLQVLTGKEAAQSLSLWKTTCIEYLDLN